MKVQLVAVVAVLAALVWGGSANAGVLYETGFEEVDGFSAGTSIDGIDGWNLYPNLYPNDGTVTTLSTGCISGTMSMVSMASDGTDGRTHPDVTFENTSDLVVSAECKIKMATNTDHTYLYLLSQSGAVYKQCTTVYFGTNGTITARDGTVGAYVPLMDGDTPMTYDADTVYSLRVVADSNTDTYDVYIDSGSGYILACNDLGYRNGPVDGGMVRFYTLTYDNPLIMDDVLIVGLLPGDANFDGSVDGSDLSLLLTGWGAGTTWPEGDFNNDLSVDGSDLSLLLSNWTYPPAGSTGSPIPEPATIGLLACGTIALVRRRRRA